MKNKDENKVKLREKLALTFKRKWLVNGTKTFLIIAIIIAAYFALNLWIRQLDLPEIDVTENQIYTLSDASKEAIAKVDQDVTIYCYGFLEDSTFVDLLKQYNKVNDKIKYEMLTEESNYEMIQEHDLQEGYTVLILKSGEAEKVVDASTDFTTYDFTTGQSVDTTEQTMTNSILSLTEENKPKIYFVQGHNEYKLEETSVLTTYLKNEAFEYDSLNIATAGAIPEDCDILAILSPDKDILDTEAQAIKDYINKGGSIYFSMDVVSEAVSLPNLQSVLDEYGVSVKNGYILEYDEGKANESAPYVFIPEVSSTHEITRDIYSDSNLWLVYSAKLEFKDEETLKNLNVTKETLVSSSDEAAFITDISSDMKTAAQTAELGKAEIGSILTKTIGEGEDAKESKLIIMASGSFISDVMTNGGYPLSYLGSNKDFVINSMAYLGDKGNNLTIRKDMANSTYLPTETQNRVVLTIIFVIPVLIIILGVAIWTYRIKRK